MINPETVIPYDDIDDEIVDLIHYMNNEPGIETTESCVGHDETPCWIWGYAKDAETFNKFWYKYFYGDDCWSFHMSMNDTQIDEGNWGQIFFLLESLPDYTKQWWPTKCVMVAELTMRFKLKQIESGLIDVSGNVLKGNV